MLKFLFCCLLALSTPLFSRELQLKNKLLEATTGSYVVLEQNKSFTFFHIYERSENAVVIEEVSIPAASFAKYNLKWKEWFESGAPGHTSWIMSQVNLATGVFEETFSFTHQGWIDMTSSNPFLTTLLNLRFQQISLEDRRRIGPAPGHNKIDQRPIWCPRLIVDGCKVGNTHFEAYKARWPSDGSELARKTIEIYLPEVDKEQALLPTYFPYWLEVEGKIGSARARVVDSGMEARSPQPPLPKRAPQLMGDIEKTADGIVFHLKSPTYFSEFMIFAEAGDTFFGAGTILPCTCKAEGEKITLTVEYAELQKLSDSDSGYYFTISPKENPNLVVETRIPFTLNAS